jgi:amino acid adenylation domain-containing protein/non-ribosomal peptide synthase protein (TIGR01720 family)
MSDTYFPLHPAQQEVYTDQLLNIDSPLYNIGGYIVLKGKLNKDKFYEVINSAPADLDFFKLRFDLQNPDFLCHYDEGFNAFQLEELDFSSEGHPDEAAKVWTQERFNIPFDLSRSDFPFEQYLLKITENEHWFFGKYHHLITDGYGFIVWVQYIASQYRSAISGQKIEFKHPSYRDAAIKAQEYLNSQAYEIDATYWKNKISYTPEKLLQRNQNVSVNGSSLYRLQIDGDKRKLIDKIQQDTKLGLQQLTIAALLIYFGKTSGHSEFLFGVPLHKRGSKVLRNIVGMFSGILPFKGNYREDVSLLDFLNEIAAALRADYRHQNYPVGDLSKSLKIDVTEGYLYDVVINYEPLDFDLNFSESIQAEIVRLANQEERNPLQLAWRDYGRKQPLELQVHLNHEYLRPEEAELLAQRIIFILEQFDGGIEKEIGSINILPLVEQTSINSFNKTETTFPQNKSLPTLFEEQVIKTPDFIAIIFDKEQLTYRELNERANQLARYLQSKGVSSEVLVPICLERSFSMIIGILGILKAGGAYVPIDREYPDERISYILEDTNATVIVSNKASSSRLSFLKHISVIELDGEDETLISSQPSSNLQSIIKPNDLAYVIYTSGSTGKPKGAMNEHLGVVNRLNWAQQHYKLNTEDSVLQKTTFCFDVSVWELLLPIISGAKLVFAKPGGHTDNSYLKGIINSEQITMLHFVPSMLGVFLPDLIPGDCKELKKVICSGEALSAALVNLFREKLPHVELHNLYGPTEAAIDVTYWKIPDVGTVQVVPIGKPVFNTQIHILDSKGDILPISVWGELHIGGVQVGRGYLNRPELTAEKFIPDPFNNQPGAKLYKTGDLARWTNDGNIEYKSRIDDQVKIRGYRIELGEIENVLMAHKMVTHVVVQVKMDDSGYKRLVAYVVAAGIFNKQELQNYLLGILPEYMVPAIWVELATLPLTPNGKLDRKALPDPDILEQLSTTYATPKNDIQRALETIWRELLNIEQAGINDDFFELGGDSVLAIQLVSRLRRLGYQLQPRDIFSHQTISRLSEFLASQSGIAIVGEQGILTGSCGLLPIQQWYLQNAPKAVSHFHQAVLLNLDKEVSQAVLQQAVQHLCQQHDALRFKYIKGENDWLQEYGLQTCEVITEDLKSISPTALIEEIYEKSNYYQGSLDIESGKLIQVVLMQTPEAENTNRLLIIIHHLAVDGVSWRILLEDLENLLTDSLNGRTNHTALKGSSYRQWYEALHLYGSSDRLLSQHNYWENIVKNYHPLIADKNYSETIYSENEHQYTIHLEPDFTRQLLQDVPKAYQTEINDILLAALAGSMSKLAESKDLIIGLEGHGRENIADTIDTSRTVGWFTSLFPVMLSTNAGNDVAALILGVKEQLRLIPDKGIGYGVLKFITQKNILPKQDPWDITFNYLGQLDTVIGNSNLLSIAQEGTGSTVSEEQVKTAKISVESYIRNGELLLQWNYSSLHYDAETIKSLAEDYKNRLVQLIQHCTEKAQSEIDSKSLSLLREVNLDDLARFVSEPNKKGRIESIYPLSSLQEGMLFHGLLSSGSGTYINQLTLDLHQVDITLFSKGWESVLQTHNILRSAFYHDDLNIPIQCVYRQAELELTVLDYTSLSEEQQNDALNEYLKKDCSRDFDFKTAPLTRFSLIQLSAGKFKMVWSTHHIIFDGWSLSVLLEEFLTNYELLASGNKLPAKEIDDFGDYIQYLQKINKADEENYWRNYLASVEQSTLLPFIKNQSDRTKGFGSYQSVTYQPDAETVKLIKEYARKTHITLNTVIQGVWAYLLSYYTQKEDVVYAVTVSGRPDDLEGVEKRVGMYINTLPLHAHIQINQNIAGWLQKIQEDQAASRQYQHTPINDIQKWTGIQGDFFDSLLVFLNYPVSRLMAQKWLLQPENVFMYEQNNFPLTITIGGTGELSVVFTYNTELLEEKHILQISKHFESVLMQIIEAGTLNKIKLLSHLEEQKVLNQFTNTASGIDVQQSLIDIIKQRVDQDPENTAIVFEQRELTYRELEERSNQFAHYLKSRGVKAETLVPICLYRSPEIIISILAVLKAGGAFVPLDPDYPQERISYMLQDTKASLIISSKAAKSKLEGNSTAQLIELDGKDQDDIANSPTSGISNHISPNQLAYVIYTSGSTGQPKGVMIEHQSLLNYLMNSKTRYTSDSEGTSGSFLHLSYTFDASITALFMPLLAGKLIVIASTQVVNVFDDANLWEYAPYDFIKLTPVHLSLLSDTVSETNRRRLTNKFVVGGEALLLKHFDKYLEKGLDAEVVNEYGPTEATVGCSTYSFNISGNNRKIKDSIPIGKPLDNTTLYVLGSNNEVLPAGIAGELYIGGSQIARGYLNRPDLTAEKFIADPFGDEAGARLYKTGDLARWLPNGNLEYLGRIDDQVKVRGYRIELGEIESVLHQHEDVKQAVVLAKEDTHGQKQLVGYVVPADEFNKESLEAFLESKLPEYMVPSLWVELDKLPVTPNGKIDKKALPDPDADSQVNQTYVAPRNEVEKKLAVIWQALLEVDEIGVNDDFFDLGGHSLSAIRLISLIRKELKTELAINDVFEYPTIALLSDHIRNGAEVTLMPSIVRVNQRPSRIPLSYSQERLWFIHNLEGSLQYHVTALFRLKGKLLINALEHALRTIVNRHEVLRTIFIEEDGRAYQVINDLNNWNLSKTDGFVYTGNAEELEEYLQELADLPFDLSKDDMLRAYLIPLTPEEHILQVTMHHIASDAWSMPVIVKEVIELYDAYREERKPLLTDLSLQYADYSIWQRTYLSDQLLTKKTEYWKNKLDGVLPLELPTDYIRPSGSSTRGAAANFTISKTLTRQLHTLSTQHGATLYMTLLATFKVLLYRYSRQEDICVGTSIAGRPQQELEELIGFFVNTLALRSTVKGNITFTELLQSVKTNTLEAYAHQEVPFEKVVEAVVKERDPSRSPLFQVMLVLQNTAEVPEIKLGDIELSAEHFEQTSVKFDLTFFVNEINEELKVEVQYRTDLYKAARIERMMSHFTTLLNAVVNEPAATVGTLEMLGTDEQSELLNTFNSSKVDYPENKSIVDLFEEQVSKSPETIALVIEGEQLTYKELNERANQLAWYLQSRGVDADTMVPICTERSSKMIVGILAIMKAGAAYVPIDTDFPADRISYMLTDSKATVIVCSRNTRPKLSNLDSQYLIEIDGSDEKEISLQATSNLFKKVASQQLAYVIYTSGSTGKPKGVMIEHRSLVDYVYGLNDKLNVAQCRSYALVSTLATDLGNTVIYSSLVFGGTLHVFSKESVSNIEYIQDYFHEHQIDCLKIVPSHWKALSMRDQLLLPEKLLIFGGEALHKEVVEEIKLSGAACRIVNHYGPTETTIGKLLHEVKPGFDYNQTIPIGKPFSNTKVYVLSPDMALCPVGVPGELYIEGDGLARGYVYNEKLSSEKFIQNPFNLTNKSLMYATGDLVQYQENGDITFIGRADNQVKIRGYRVEPGEIESVLQDNESVKQALVVASKDKQGNNRLVAYIIAAEDFNRDELLSYLKEILPEYMVPALVIELNELPLMANGKVDRKALPNPDSVEAVNKEYTPARNATEETLVTIWQDVLEEDKIGIHDDFFELGGHSLLAVRLISAIRKAFKAEIPISDVFDYPTIAALAKQLQEHQETSTYPQIKIGARPEQIPLSFSQERLWFIDRLEGSVQYHVPAVLKLKGKLDIKALANSLQEIINRHEVLRTVIREKEGRPYQFIKEKGEWNLEVVEGTQYDTELKDVIEALIRKPFDLSKDYMLRASVFTLTGDENLLVINLHHIASDGWSRSVLVKELVELYGSFIYQRLPQVPNLPVQYADFAIWQQAYLQGELLENKLDYWRKKLQNVAPLGLPTDFVRPAIQGTQGALVKFDISQELKAQILKLSQSHGATLYMTLLSAFKVLIYRYSGQEDICVGTGIAGRQQQELEGLIGFFVNTLAMRSQLDGEMSFTELLESVKSTTMEAYAHQDVPFEKVVEAVSNERDISRNPIFQVTFVVQNTPEVPELKLGDVLLSVEDYDHVTTKFDITFSITETENGLEGIAEYNTALYKELTITRMTAHFVELLKSVIAQPETQIGQLSLLGIQEEKALLSEHNSTEVWYPKDKSLVDLFEAQVQKNPGAVALVFEEQELTYTDLNELSNRLAHYLKAEGVGSEQLVPIFIERGIWMIAGILGILKAGGVYVPIDPEYPEERIRFMLEDTGAAVIVSNKVNRSKLEGVVNAAVIEVDGVHSALISSHSIVNPVNTIAPSQAAYVIYTSGSTGKPKGVVVEHGSVVNLIHTQTAYFDIKSDDRILQFSNYCFDASVEQIFLALFNGAPLVLFPEGLQYDTALFETYLRDQKITHLHATPFLLENITPDNYVNLKRVIAGGDVCRKELASRWRDKVNFYNEYGPTETTVTAIEYHDHDKGEGRNIVPIGTPLSNVTVYILDKNQALCPEGIPGELYIGGVQVARGYLNRPDITAERFIPNPFKNNTAERLYRTGDLVRRLTDGNLEYLGRIDDQVKIRGYRIELGEVESVLNELEPVENSCVLVKADVTSGSRLLAYYIPDIEIVKKKEHELYSQQVESWKEIHENEYVLAEEEEIADPEFNILGWNNSFTRKPIEAEQMREWLDDITNVILAEKPEQVLEIGSGTGLIYYRLAGKIKKYIGTDFSSHSINKIKERVNEGLRDYGATELQVCAAHEISLKENEQPDTIIINSVAQYFPGGDYLNIVIEKGISLMKGYGRIIIGDIRDKRTLELFKSRLQLSKQQESVSLDEFKWAVEQEVLKEEELCFSPEYFYSLQETYPEITHVDIQWKQGSYINELSQYRFTAIIHIGIEKSIIEPKWQEWNSNTKSSTLSDIRNGKPIIAIKDAPNPRLWQEKQLLYALTKNAVSTTKELAEVIEKEDVESFEVAELISAAKAEGYQYRLFLDEDPLKINILFEKAPVYSFVKSVFSDKTINNRDSHTNIPLFADISLLLQKEIRALLQQRLPDYMIPSEFIILRHFPLNHNGKVNRKFLSQTANRASGDTLNYQPPRNETEQTLARIWQELLNIEQAGIHDNFFELGGHSLLGMRVVSSIRKELEVELVIKDLFIHPTIAELAAFLKSQNKGLLFPTIEVEARPHYIPLSYSQERLWFIDQLEGSTRYHLPSVFRLKGELDTTKLEQALVTIVDRHEVLRTVILENEGLGYQHVVNPNEWRLEIKDGSVYKDSSERLESYINKLISKPFDLSKDYMFRATLIRITKDEHVLVVTMHHIASDAWSTSVIVAEVVELYSSYVESRPYLLPQLPIQYADYSVWQRKYLAGEVLDKKINYWKSKLNGVLPLQLPSDYSRPAVWSGQGSIIAFSIDKKLSSRLLSIGKQEGATLFMILQAAFNVLLNKYSNQEDICIGTSVANRTQKEVEGLIGFFVNMLPLRSEVRSDLSFKELLQQVKVTTMEAYEQQDVPFEKVVDAVIKDRDMSRNPLIQVMLILLNTPDVPEIRLGNVLLSEEVQEKATTLFDLSFFVAETTDGMQIKVQYATDLYRENTIRRLIGHFKQLLLSIALEPDQKVGRLKLLTEKEERTIHTDFNNTVSVYPQDSSIIALFEEQVKRTPESIALMFEGEQLTYHQLNKQANQLAHHLQNLGLRKGALVPICIGRSLELIIGIIGILKAGGAYVPIDPEYPEDRIRYMIEDTAADIAISSKENRVFLEASNPDIRIVELDTDITKYQSLPSDNLSLPLTSEDLSYIIYTSGSTGKPKGVLVKHGNVVSLVKEVSYVDLSENDILLSTGSPSFDASTLEYWGMLLNGGRLILCSENRLLNSDLLKKEIVSNGVSKMWFTSSWFNQLVETDITVFKTLDTILVGGEKLSEKHIKQLCETYPDINIVNGYGPTENTTFSLTYKIDDLSVEKTIPIGKPLTNRKVYILDGQLQLCPVGITGEIFVGGAGLSLGYLNQPELTAEKFVNNFFDTEPGSRLYKTGDLGRWLPDGNVEFIGRIDDQVKIRGYRIELGEIEKVLEQNEMVSSAVVLAQEDENAKKRLVAYVLPEHTFDKEAMKSFLLNKLPEYMVPALWVELTSIPLTSNGKIDKKALPDPDMTEMQSQVYTSPRTDFEVQMAEIWQDLLGIEQVGIHDNFFELGGDSILTIQVVSRMRRLGYEFQVTDIFNHQTIDKLSQIINSGAAKNESDEQELLNGFCELLPVQQWFFEMQLDDISHFNQSVLLSVDKSITIAVLNQAVKQLLKQHDALRFAFSKKEGKWQQEYKAEIENELIVEDFKLVSDDSLASLVTEHANEHQRSLDIEKGELIRVVLMQTPLKEAYNRLFIVIHHLVVDGVSWRILLDDLEALLNGIVNNENIVLGSKSSSYRQWYQSLEGYSQSRKLLLQKNYWQNVHTNYEPLPTDKPYNGFVKVKDIGFYTIQFNEVQTLRLIQEVPKVYHTEINDLLLSALAKTLCAWIKKDKIVIGLEGHGRENVADNINTSRTVGWFTSIYPLMIEGKSENPGDLIKSVKEQLRHIPDKGLGYGVLKYINKESSLQGREPWDILFNYLGQLDNAVSESKWLKVAEEFTGAGRSTEQEVKELLSVSCYVLSGQLTVRWNFSNKHFKEETITMLATEYISRLEWLITHCIEVGKNGAVYTPSDYGIGSEISYEELDKFLEDDDEDNIMSF